MESLGPDVSSPGARLVPLGITSPRSSSGFSPLFVRGDTRRFNSDLMASQFDFTIARCPRRRHFTLADFTRTLSSSSSSSSSSSAPPPPTLSSSSSVSSKNTYVRVFHRRLDEFSIFQGGRRVTDGATLLLSILRAMSIIVRPGRKGRRVIPWA